MNVQIRLLICFVATHPEKMDQSKADSWAQLAGLSDADMAAIISLESLGVPVRKKGAAGKSKIFSRKAKAPKNTRKVRSAGCCVRAGGWVMRVGCCYALKSTQSICIGMPRKCVCS